MRNPASTRAVELPRFLFRPMRSEPRFRLDGRGEYTSELSGAALSRGAAPDRAVFPRAMSDLSVSGDYGVPSSGNDGSPVPSAMYRRARQRAQGPAQRAGAPSYSHGDRGGAGPRDQCRGREPTEVVLGPGGTQRSPPAARVRSAAFFRSNVVQHTSSLSRPSFDRRPCRRSPRAPTAERASTVSSAPLTTRTSEVEVGTKMGAPSRRTPCHPCPTGKVFHVSATSGPPRPSDTWVEDPRAGEK